MREPSGSVSEAVPESFGSVSGGFPESSGTRPGIVPEDFGSAGTFTPPGWTDHRCRVFALTAAAIGNGFMVRSGYRTRWKSCQSVWYR